MELSEADISGRILVELTEGDSESPEFDSIAALLEWRAREGRDALIKNVAFVVPSSSDEPCARKIEGLRTKVTLNNEDGQLTITCQGGDSIGLLMRMLRWYYHDRFTDVASANIKVTFAGLGSEQHEFESPEALDAWLAGEGRGILIEMLVYEAPTSYVGSKVGRYNRPGPCVLEVANGKITVTASGPYAADTLTRVLYLHSMSFPENSPQD